MSARKRSAASFYDEMQRLWLEHVFWTRQFIVSAATLPEPLPDAEQTAVRLMANQAEIGDAFEPYYGRQAANELTRLLVEHIKIAGRVVAAAKAKDSGAARQESGRWYANADQIADFLSKANQKAWPREHMRQHMRDHLELTLAEAQERINGNYVGDIAAFQKVETQILAMAHAIAMGLIQQFPHYFADARLHS